MKETKFGAFSQLYGKTLRNRVVEFILELGELDFAAGDILEEINISKPKLYELIRELEEENIINKSRVVSGTQLYVLNIRNNKVKLLMKSFNECLKTVIEESKEDLIFAERVEKLWKNYEKGKFKNKTKDDFLKALRAC
ncbi:MAG: hypothetical protein ABIB43_04785 [archaeon]